MSGSYQRAADLLPGQRLPGLPFGYPPEREFRVDATIRPGDTEDEGMVRVFAKAVEGHLHLSVLMRRERKLRVLGRDTSGAR